MALPSEVTSVVKPVWTLHAFPILLHAYLNTCKKHTAVFLVLLFTINGIILYLSFCSLIFFFLSTMFPYLHIHLIHFLN